MVLGIALAIALASGFLAAVHDGWIAQREITQQNYLAPLVVVLLMGPLLGFNALIRWFTKRFSLRAAEIALVACLALAASPLTRAGSLAWVSTVGHTNALLDARHASVSKLSKSNPYDQLPKSALLDLNSSRQFDQGLTNGSSNVMLANPLDIPWQMWVGPAMTWLPLMVCFIVLALAISVVLQSHWANRELLTFPLAQLTSQLLPQGNRHWPAVFHSPVFWGGFAFAGLIFLTNGLHAHYDKMIEIPTSFSYYSLSQQFSFLKNSLEGYSLLRGTVFFAVVAAAVLLPSEISFTAWFCWPLMVIASYTYYTQTGLHYSGHDNNIAQLGAAIGLVALIIYSGRNFYLNLLRQAICAGGRDADIKSRERIYARLGIAAGLGLTACLIAWGLPWDVAIIWTLASVLFMVVVSRLTAEMGLYWTPLIGLGPLASLVTLLGDTGLGVNAYALAAVVTSVLVPNPGTAVLLAPAVAHGLEVERRAGPSRLTVWAIGPFLMLALVLGIVMHIWLGYSVGGQGNDYYSLSGISHIRNAAQFGAMPGINAQDSTIGSRLSLSQMRPGTLTLLSFGAGLVILFGVLRLRLPKFPLHPLPLVVMGSWVLSRFWLSFFIGWLIKKILVMIGGNQLFDKAKPFFIGLFAGQCGILGFWVLVNIGMYATNGGISDALWWQFMSAMFSF